ncbi:hypothetical protein BHE74_00035755 [Ensete ventricosum]|nr:hypothetical protein GW17_00006651 [Ensete ventricosum]RWW57461.1 hypothetical protein BHE74_00035755 [Ensete ventricosum]
MIPAYPIFSKITRKTHSLLTPRLKKGSCPTLMVDNMVRLGNGVEKTPVQNERLANKLHREDSSSSDSDTEKTSEPSAADAVKAKIYTLFGREKAVHQILGGGKRTGPLSVARILLFYR